MADEPKLQPPATTPEAQQVLGFPTDVSNLSTVYTNFCRVNVTPEELVLDFGLNTKLVPDPMEPVKLTHRVVMNFYTAKRLMQALGSVVAQVENNYGALELDYQKRARGPISRATGPVTRPTP
jgi:hypothetical protein